MVTFSHKTMTWKKTIVSTGPFLTETIVESNCQNGTNLYAQYVSWGSISSFAIIYFTWLPWQPLSKLDEIRQIVVLNYFGSEEPFFCAQDFPSSLRCLNTLATLNIWRQWSFFLNVFTGFSEFNDKKILVIKRTRTCDLLFKRPECYHSTSKAHVRDRIFKFSPIHASVIDQICWIHWVQWKFCSIQEKLHCVKNLLHSNQIIILFVIKCWHSMAECGGAFEFSCNTQCWQCWQVSIA